MQLQSGKIWDDIYIRPFRNMYWAYPYLKNLGSNELLEKALSRINLFLNI